MKHTKIIILTTVVIIAGLYSCELLDDNSNLTVAERLEGRWQVEENNPFKSAEDSYPVYIDISPIDSNSVLIGNFLELGNGIDAIANISGMELILPNQNVGEGFRVYGSGNISSNYKQITWRYYVDEGSGIWSEVNSIYTKLDY